MKRGLIKISDSLYQNEWHLVYIFFKDFRPSHIEFRHWENNTWYFYGTSELFDDVKEGEPVPQYDVIITTEAGNITYKFERYAYG